MIWHHDILIINQTSTGTNEYGDDTFTDDSGTSTKAWVQPLDATEEEVSRDTRVNRFHVLVPPDATVSAVSKIQWEGRNFQVVGDPLPYYNRSGLHHLEFDMREVVG